MGKRAREDYPIFFFHYFHLFQWAKCFTFVTVGYDVEEGQDVSFVSIKLISVTEKKIAIITKL